jgi:hypothetical protein
VKETKVFMFDDLDYAGGERVEADRSVVLRFGVDAVELDLTDAHIKELADYLAPYFAAGSAPEQPAPRPAPPPSSSSAGRAPTAYNAGMRRYADDRGISYRTPSGGVYYPAQLQAEYAEFLAQGGRP